ncbi:ABC transporter permease [Specibacter cremeus]|uniref:ABC transporter permease n=1 Tax=Specibacter cremeus TaxID=1629051 RepID=UPI0013DE4BD7|nr:ABC transporter permease [Specibacter cremeus]
MNHTPGRKTLHALALPLAAALGLAAYAIVANNIFVSTPQELWDRAVAWWPDGWATDLLPSVRNVLIGFAVSVVVGVGVGMALGSSRFLRAYLLPTVDFIRAIPNAAIVPVLLLIFGFSASTRILIVFLTAVWPILLGAMDGVLAADPRQGEMARAYRIPPLIRFFRITLPGASPQILAGVKVGLTVSIVVVVISEMFGATDGLGHFIIASQRQFDIAGVWVGTITIALIGYGLNAVFALVQKRLLRWHPSTRIDAQS